MQTKVFLRCLSSSAEQQTDEKHFIDKGIQVYRPVYNFEDVQQDDSEMLFYTGIPNKETIYAVFVEIKGNAFVSST